MMGDPYMHSVPKGARRRRCKACDDLISDGEMVVSARVGRATWMVHASEMSSPTAGGRTWREVMNKKIDAPDWAPWGPITVERSITNGAHFAVLSRTSPTVRSLALVELARGCVPADVRSFSARDPAIARLMLSERTVYRSATAACLPAALRAHDAALAYFLARLSEKNLSGSC